MIYRLKNAFLPSGDHQDLPERINYTEDGMNSRKKAFIPIAVIFFTVIAILIFIAVRLYDYYYGMHRIKAETYLPVVAEDEYNVVYDCGYAGKAIVVDGEVYIDIDIINLEWGRELFFYAEDIKTVLYTTQKEQTEFPVGGPDIQERDGKAYILGRTCSEMFGMRFTVNKEDRIVMVRKPSAQMANVEKFRTYLLQTPSEEERFYTEEAGRNDTLEIYGEEENGYYFAVSENGHMGYVDASRITLSPATLTVKEPDIWETDEDTLYSHVISLGFHQIYTNEFNSDVYEPIYDTSYYLSVLAPTWFSLSDSGGLKSLVNTDYLEWASWRGYNVWPVFTNSFDDDLTYETLSDTYKRRALVNQLVTVLKMYDMDGLNVDFEGMSEKTYPYFIQFLRELSIGIRSEDILLSIDTAVPSEWTDYYRRDIYNDLCDYVIVMAYDEYWGGSEVAGPVSSKSFTVNAIVDTIACGVDKDKIILGMPWYTRIWYGDDYDLETEAVGMRTAWLTVYDYDMDVSYDESTGLNYAEGEVEGRRCRIWLEDEDSVRWRLKLALDSDLAGIAAWSIGLENSYIWPAYEDLLMKSYY